MGLFDFLPCCGPRKEKVKDVEANPETTSLIPPPREESIISADGLAGGYGSTNEGLTDEQRLRIEAIGREVGSHMLPIHSLPPGHNQRSSPSLSRNSHSHHPHTSGAGIGANGDGNTSIGRPLSPSSQDSLNSRPNSPSPQRPETSPAGGVMQHTGDRGAAGGEGGDDDVVRKTLFVGGGGMGNRKTSGRGRGGAKRGRGRK